MRVCTHPFLKFVYSFLSLRVSVDVREFCRVPSPRCFGFITGSVSAASLGVFFSCEIALFFLVCLQSSKVIRLIIFFLFA